MNDVSTTLNDVVLGVLRSSGIDPTDTENNPVIIHLCRRVVTDAGFRLSSERHPEWDGTTECDQVERYINDARETVNLWIVDVQGVGFADGGLGFDDQTG
jgi:hypothetical protein